MAIDTLSLAGKIAIVTGSGRENGIGAGIAIALARNGASVTIHYVSDSVIERAHATAEKINVDGGNAIVVQTSIETLEGVKHLVNETLRGFNTDRVDILVNNAGTATWGDTLAVEPEQLTKVFDVNVNGPIFLAQAVVPLMKPGGRIINISSIASRLGDASIPVYGASKAALDSLTWSWAKEWGRTMGITVNSVAPGPVLTDSNPVEEFQQPAIDITRAADRAGTPEDIADAVLLLVSEKARWITGQYISDSYSAGQGMSPDDFSADGRFQPDYVLMGAGVGVCVADEAPVCKMMRELCFALAFVDDSAMHLVIARLEIEPERNGGRPSKDSSNTLSHYNASIEILRYQLGLQTMIQYRGGIRTLSSRYLQVTATWTDLFGSIIIDASPYFELQQADKYTSIYAGFESTGRFSNVEMKSKTNITILLDLLSTLSNLATGKSELELSKDDGLLDILQATVHTALTIPRYGELESRHESLLPCLITHELVRLAVLTYLSGPVMFLAGSLTQTMIASHYKGKIAKLYNPERSSWVGLGRVELFVLVVAALCEDREDRCQLTAHLHRAMLSQGLEWEGLVKMIHSMAWFDYVWADGLDKLRHDLIMVDRR
ncbi:hypothetical protein FGRMN_6105 [Fusarium graminum]|nr:hypothetical protein FGRMN_6105 [Fusarium graminum]